MVEAVVVPKDLYYHEIAYVRRLEELLEAANALIGNLNSHEGAEGFSFSTMELQDKYDTLLGEHKELSK